MVAEPKTSSVAQQLQKKEQTEQAPFFSKEGGQGDYTHDSGTPFFNSGNGAGFFQKKQDSACKPPVQTKLTVGQPGDKYEQEADQVADKVVQRLAINKSAPVNGTGNTGLVQRKCDACEKEEKDAQSIQKMPEQISRKPIFESNAQEDTIQRKCASCGKEMEDKAPGVQADSDSPTGADSGGLSNIESGLSASKGGGSPLPANTQSSMGSAMGADFSGVRVHTDSNAVQMSKDLGAHAFTHGSDVYFNSGKYDTGSSGGQRLLAHELTHTVQQGGAGVQKKQENAGGNGNSNSHQKSEDDGNSTPLAVQKKDSTSAIFPATDAPVSNAHLPIQKKVESPELSEENEGNSIEGEFGGISGATPPTGTDNNNDGTQIQLERNKTIQPKALVNIAAPTIQAEKAVPAIMPNSPLDITTSFEPTQDWRNYLDTQSKRSKIPVKVKIGNNYEGIIYVTPEKANSADPANFYKLSSEPVGGQFLEIKGIPFFEEFKAYKLIPVIYLNNWTRKDRLVKGYLTIKKGERAATGVNKFAETFADNLDALGYLGIEKPKMPKIENTFENGRLTFKATDMSTVVARFLKAGGSIGIVNNVFTFELNAHVDVKGVAQGQLDLRRDESGQFGGKVEIDASIQNIAAKLTVEYIKSGEEADVIIQGTGSITSEKFKGTVGFIVADQSKAKGLMHAQLGVATVEEQKNTEQKAPKKNKRKEPQVLVGWGTVTATITPWLEGTAKVGIDDVGHVTIVGEITVPNEVKLMEERGKKVTLFSVKIKGGYGVPLVGQVYLFAGINLFVNAGFGPLVLKNVRFEGVYSTDPAVLQKFSITGTLGINAFAVVGLEAEAGVGLTLIGHDIEAGINVSAAAGIRAYAEVSPTFEYVESQAEQGGKVGEAWLRGHFEAAAQLFLQLGGKFFVRLDSPWWSPAPDKTWDYPFDNVTYPIGDSMGIGGDVDWKVGSSDLPELNFTPIEFDPDKFTADVMADPPPGKGDGGEKKPDGTWDDQGQGNGNMEADPTADPSKAKGLDGQKKEDLSKLTDQERYMRALDEISKLSESANTKPMTYSVLDAKTKKIKSKYGVDLVKIEGSKKDENVDIYVKHKTDDNGDHKINVKLITEAERIKLLEVAVQDLEEKEKAVLDQAGAIKKKDADHIAQQIPHSHPIIEHVAVIDGGDAWKFELDYGDIKKVSPGKPKAESDKVKEGDDEQSIKVKAEVKEKINAGIHSTVEDENAVTPVLQKIYSEYAEKGLKTLRVVEPDPNDLHFNILVSASKEIEVAKFVLTQPKLLIDDIIPVSRESKSATWIIADYNGLNLGKIYNTPGGKHAEINLLGLLHNKWSKLPHKNNQEDNVLTLETNRSHCGADSANCTLELHKFASEKKIKIVSKPMSLYFGKSYSQKGSSIEALRFLLTDPKFKFQILDVDDLRIYGFDLNSMLEEGEINQVDHRNIINKISMRAKKLEDIRHNILTNNFNH